MGGGREAKSGEDRNEKMRSDGRGEGRRGGRDEGI